MFAVCSKFTHLNVHLWNTSSLKWHVSRRHETGLGQGFSNFDTKDPQIRWTFGVDPLSKTSFF